jgi:Ca2+-binding RTX toxin-like protein
MPVTAGPEISVNGTTAGNQQSPQIARLPGGGYIIVWADSSGIGGDASVEAVKGRLFDSSGVPVGPEFLINQNTLGRQYEPKLAVLESGNFVVTWTDATGDGSGSAVKGRLYDSSGTPLGGEFLVNTITSNDEWQPCPAALPGGGFVVTWANQTGDSSLYAVKAQIFDAAATTVGGEFLVNTTQFLYQDNGKVTALASGNFVVVWDDFSHSPDDPSGYAVRGQIFDPAGNQVGGEFLVNTSTSGDQSVDNRSVTALASGGFVVAWSDNGGAGGDSGWGIRAQLFDGSGAKAGAEIFVNTNLAGNQDNPTTAALPDGGFVVTWRDATGDGSAYSIKAQLFDASGVPVGTEFLVNTATGGDQVDPSVIALPYGFAVTWADASGVGGDADGFGIKLRLFSLVNVINGTEDDDILDGTNGDDVINGLGGDDILSGQDGDDTLNGGDGLDFLLGGRGVDTYDGGSGGFDAINFADLFATQGAVADIRTGIVSNDGFGNVETLTSVEGFASGTRFVDTLYGDDGLNPFAGGTGDYIYAFGGDDFVNIEGAPALIDGGDGEDAVNAFRQARLVDSNGDGIAEWETTTNGVSIDLSLGMILDDGFGGSGALVSIENIVGSAGADTLVGSNDANWIRASAGDDVVVGRGGNDQLEGGDGTDLLLGDGTFLYTGPSGNDSLAGGGGNDVMRGGGGIDTFDGGEGFDRVSFFSAAATEGAVASLLTQTITSDGYGHAETMTSIEGLGGGTAFADHFTGDDNANELLGDAGDTLLGNGGDDNFFVSGANLIDGGAGIDTVEFFSRERMIPDTNSDGLAETVSTTLGVDVDLRFNAINDDGFGNGGTIQNVENVRGSQYDDQIFGDVNANNLWGLAGNDFLFGFGGGDTLEGGDGNDTLRGEGGAGYNGPTGNDTLIGGTGDDYMNGGGGTDTYDGGDGFDRVSFYNLAATQGAIASLLTQTITNDGFGNAETMVSVEGLGAGTAYADQFTGGDNANLFFAEAGDTVIANGGDDQFQLAGAPALLDGGDGIDTIIAINGELGMLVPDQNSDGLAELVFATQGVVVDLRFNAITDGFGNSGTIVNVENVGGGDLDDQIFGDGNDNHFWGFGGNDFLFGFGGGDTIEGGDGDDTLRGDGNALYNGPGGDDILIGGAGDDYMNGMQGVDSYDGGDGFDRVSFFNYAATQGAIASLLTQTISNDGFGNAETMVSVEALGAGTAYADQFTGDDNANLFLADAGDTIIANGGDDEFQLAGAPDLLDGGDGIDTISTINGELGMLVPDQNSDGLAELVFATQGVVVDLRFNAITDGFGNNGTVVNVENVGGGDLDDQIFGDGNDNHLWGFGGADLLRGFGGDDTIEGG